MDKDRLAGRGKTPQSADHTAHHAVGVADMLRQQAGNLILLGLPAEDGVKIFLPGLKVAEGGMLCPGDDGFLHSGNRGEIHIRHPHRDGIKAFPGSAGQTGQTQCIHRKGIHTFALHDRGKVKFHFRHPSFSSACGTAAGSCRPLP